MKVKVISNVPVRVDKEVYSNGQIVEIDKKYFNEKLFESLEKTEKKTVKKTDK